MRLRTRSTWNLTAATGLLTALGVGERGLPDPGAVEPPPQPAGTIPREAALTPVQRRLALAPLRGGRVGALTWDGTRVRQTSPVTCGALSLLLLAAAGDPVLASWLTTGARVGPVPPPELARLSREELALDDVAARVAVAERAVHGASRHATLGPFDWPRAVGTPPWGAARVARFRGVEYTHTPVNDGDVARTRVVLDTVRAATRLGIPVPLFTGGDLGRGGSPAAAVPRHVVLAVPHRNGTSDLRILEPSAGSTFQVPIDALLGRTRGHAALGGWSHVVWAVLPRSAYR
ncbi:hypothetical protein EDD28_2084 [Salana multivorans]|uniref:Uncharacterized protein n=1 Tax=Salana multivorans TaxID=120377 RepID=A0A3N2DCG9_9MICO|nr:hypothetical protein [Salana multivorans]ROR97485.1 hypothetical protein EDD28_2084 [Salana multivorans]